MSHVRMIGSSEVYGGWRYPVHYFLFPLFVPVLVQEDEGEWLSTESVSCDHHPCHSSREELQKVPFLP